MPQNFFEDRVFEKFVAKIKPLEKGVYECCIFDQCDLSNADLSGIHFIECEFKGCNTSNSNITDVVFRETTFKNCKMLGMDFSTCSEQGVIFTFEDCQLDHSIFQNTDIKSTLFKNTQLKEVDFTGCNLTRVIFSECDLMDATFENTNLTKADLRLAFNFTINPELNIITKAKFTLSGLYGLLKKYDIEIE